MRLFSLQNTPRLLVVIVTALVQGGLLLWLHLMADAAQWPATDKPWQMAFYGFALFVPLTVQLMSEHWRSVALWCIAAVLAVLYFYFGWHLGSQLMVSDGDYFPGPQGAFTLIVGVLLWLHLLPFVDVRLASGRWRCAYEQLFGAACQRVIMLAEAALFTGLFWALLMLWAVLFKMLGYGFFEWLFKEPAFAYPFTTVAFGVALYLTGSLDRLVALVRGQVFGVLKWLAPVAGLILLLFTPTLLFKLPELVFHGERAIGAGWLLWLIAFTVLLINAGFQEGRVERPYPPVIAMFLRIVVPGTVIVGGTALYALFVRISEYGITVERMLGFIVALFGFAFSIGYTVAAVRRGRWFGGIERVNVCLALALIAVLALMLSPVLSPYRLAAASQYHRALEAEGERLLSALQYLRFRAGAYGGRALERLASLEGEDERTAEVRRQARLMRERNERWAPAARLDARAVFDEMAVYPAGRAMDPELLEVLREDYPSMVPIHGESHPGALAVFADLNEDGVEECVVMLHPYYYVYTRRDGGWKRIQTEYSDLLAPGRAEMVRQALEAGDFSVEPSRWQDLRIGPLRLSIEDQSSRIHVERPSKGP